VNGWVFNPHGMRGRASAFDFPLRFILAAMCNNPGRFNMADLDHAGLAGISPLNAVTFVENHDTDLKEPVVTNKILGYAYILTSEGYPCVYYRDYSEEPNCYGLKKSIDNLIWIHENLASGTTQQRWLDFNLFVYERFGGPGLLVGLNNDPRGPRTVLNREHPEALEPSAPCRGFSFVAVIRCRFAAPYFPMTHLNAHVSGDRMAAAYQRSVLRSQERLG
jgi:hypothetical protein